MNGAERPSKSSWLDFPGRDLRPDSPFRSLDWRWKRASELARSRKRRLWWDDRRVVLARQFLFNRQRVGGELTGPGLAREDPAVLGAVQLSQGSPRRRWEIEARILAAQSDEEIGARIGVTAGVVDMYESLFFAAREWLSATDWIMCDAIGPRIFEGLAATDVDVIWKYFGFQGGPLVLDAFIAHHDADQGGSTTPLEPRLAFLCQAAIDAMVLRSDDARGVLRLDTLIRELAAFEGRNPVAAATGTIEIAPEAVRIGPPASREGDSKSDPEGLVARQTPVEACDPESDLDAVDAIQHLLRPTG